jgi:hypothetical protein
MGSDRDVAWVIRTNFPSSSFPPPSTHLHSHTHTSNNEEAIIIMSKVKEAMRRK